MRKFIELWITLLREAMAKTGNGYKRHSLRNTGKGDDRRKDKLEQPEKKMFRNYRNRYAVN